MTINTQFTSHRINMLFLSKESFLNKNYFCVNTNYLYLYCKTKNK